MCTGLCGFSTQSAGGADDGAVMMTPSRLSHLGRVLLVGLCAGQAGCVGPATFASFLPGVEVWLRVQAPQAVSPTRTRTGQGLWLGATAAWQLGRIPHHIASGSRSGSVSQGFSLDEEYRPSFEESEKPCGIEDQARRREVGEGCGLDTLDEQRGAALR